MPDNLIPPSRQALREALSLSEEILKNTPVSEKDQEKVLLALWFHDTGYIECAKEHEEKGAEIAKKFLQKENYPENDIDDVVQLIFLPHELMPTNPAVCLKNHSCPPQAHAAFPLPMHLLLAQ